MQTVLLARRLGLPYGPFQSLWQSSRRPQKVLCMQTVTQQRQSRRVIV